MKRRGLTIGDFSVLIKDIPVRSSDYEDSFELLKAMLAGHLEELMRIEA